MMFRPVLNLKVVIFGPRLGPQLNLCDGYVLLGMCMMSVLIVDWTCTQFV